MSKTKGIYCQCLEAKLPAHNNRPIKVIFQAFLDQYAAEPKSEYANEKQLHKKLKAFGLDPHEIELVMSRVLENKTMTQVVKEQGWTNVNSANHYLRKALKKLRDGGFNKP